MVNSKKIWNIEGGHFEDGFQKIQKIKETLHLFSDGLNSSQDVLKSKIEIRSVTSSFTFIDSIKICLVVFKNDSKQSIDLITCSFPNVEVASPSETETTVTISYFAKPKKYSIKISKLEKFLDDIIISSKMGNYISHLIRCGSFSPDNI